MENKFQCIVIGAGPAGMQAALFLGRASVKTLIIGVPEKSDLAYGRVIGNYFGLPDEWPGKTLLDNGLAQIKKYGVEFLGEEAVDAEKLREGGFKIVSETKKEFFGENLIIASGAAHIKAGIQNEDKLLGKGVHICVACDGVFFKDKKVAVVGSGSHALQEAVELAAFSKDITVFTQGDKPDWAEALLKLAREQGIKISDKRVKNLAGDRFVQKVILSDGSEEAMDGIFVALGSASSITFAYKLGLEQKGGFLAIDRDGKTNVDGVWAAGGCTGGNAQIAKSVGDGANAAISTIKTVKGLAQYSDQT